MPGSPPSNSEIAELFDLIADHLAAKDENPFRGTAHNLGKTNDWVVVYYESGKGENQCTVVTEQRGPMKAKRGRCHCCSSATAIR